MISMYFVYNFALRMYGFRQRWSATLKNRGRSKKTHGRTALKCGGSSLAVGSFLQRVSALPPPPHPGCRFTPSLFCAGVKPGPLSGVSGCSIPKANACNLCPLFSHQHDRLWFVCIFMEKVVSNDYRLRSWKKLEKWEGAWLGHLPCELS